MTTGTLGYCARRIDQAREALHARHAQVEQDQVEVVVLGRGWRARPPAIRPGDGGVGDAAGNRLLQRLAEQRDGRRRSVCELPPGSRPSLPCLNLRASFPVRSSSAVLAEAMRLKPSAGRCGASRARRATASSGDRPHDHVEEGDGRWPGSRPRSRGRSPRSADHRQHARFLRLGIAHLAQHGSGNRKAEACVGIALRPALQTVVDGLAGSAGRRQPSSARSR